VAGHPHAGTEKRVVGGLGAHVAGREQAVGQAAPGHGAAAGVMRRVSGVGAAAAGGGGGRDERGVVVWPARLRAVEQVRRQRWRGRRRQRVGGRGGGGRQVGLCFLGRAAHREEQLRRDLGGGGVVHAHHWGQRGRRGGGWAGRARGFEPRVAAGRRGGRLVVEGWPLIAGGVRGGARGRRRGGRRRGPGPRQGHWSSLLGVLQWGGEQCVRLEAGGPALSCGGGAAAPTPSLAPYAPGSALPLLVACAANTPPPARGRPAGRGWRALQACHLTLPCPEGRPRGASGRCIWYNAPTV
jgi:hypothetical protein